MTQSRKIGVLTFHRCINYGSYWQARCLVEGLRAMGHDAVLLDHHSCAVNRLEWRCALDPQLPVKSDAKDRALHKKKTRRFFTALEELPFSRRFDLDDPQALESFDVVLVGSDEVWNLHHPWYSGRAIFYGRGIKADRLVSYAASFGNYDASHGLPAYWSDALSGFTQISVRDDNSARIVRNATGREPAIVLDPCLQFPPAGENAGGTDAGHPYVAVYGHGFPDWFAAGVRSYAETAGYRLVSIGYRNDWAHEQLIAAGPHRFAQLMANAAAVATNFFHGCVFSLLNAKPFACTSSAYRANKLTDLMGLLSTERHLVSEASEPSRIRDVMGMPLERAALSRIAELRERSSAFLERAVA